MDISINGARILYTIENVPILGTVNVTQSVVVGLFILILISALCIWLGSGLKVTGISRKQAVAEMIYEALVDFVHGNMGTNMDQYIPLVGALFATCVVSNLCGLIGFWTPSADLMCEVAWAVVVFIVITYNKIKAAGIGGYLKSFAEPIAFMAPINVVSEVFTPVSMAFRQFGNVLSGSVISTLVYAALAAASYALFGALGSSLPACIVILALGIVCVWQSKAREMKFLKYLGIVLLVLGGLGALALITDGLSAQFPWLTIGIPALLSFYFDWFSGCVQGFIFCTLTTIFIKQAADME